MSSQQFDYSPERFVSFPVWAWRQLFERPQPITDIDLSEKTAIVTGANQGIGFEIANQLLLLNIGKLVIGVRNVQKGRAAAGKLASQHCLDASKAVEVWKLDMLDYASVRTFASRAAKLEHLDIAILNAGIYRMKFTINESTRHEEDVQTNYLSTVLLALLLLPTLRSRQGTAAADSSSSRPPGRLTIVSSDTAGMIKFPERDADPLLERLDDPRVAAREWDMQERYATSRLLGQLFVAELARRVVVPASAVVVNVANPGLCAGSGLGRDADGTAMQVALAIFFGFWGRRPAAGASVVVNAAVKQNEGSHGQLVDFDRIRPMAGFVYSAEAAAVTARLWKETMEELAFADVQGIVESLSIAP